MQFNYQARTNKGKIKTGTVEAVDREEAKETLEERGLIVIALESEEEVPIFARGISFFERVKKKEIVLLLRQLSTLFVAKIPLVTSLRTLSGQAVNPALKQVLFKIAKDVEGGIALSEAMAKYPKVFSDFFVNMVKAGELSGKLDSILSYLADYSEKEYELNSKIKGAMTYPAFVLGAFTIAAILLMVMVVPQLTAILKEAGTELPLTTRLLIAMSDFMRTKGWVMIILLAGLAGGGWFFINTSQGRTRWDRIKLRIPILGELATKIYLTRIGESLSTLIRGGLPIMQSLKVTARIVGNAVYRDLLFEAADEIKGGKTIQSVFDKSDFVPPIVTQMIGVGERTGKIDFILEKIAGFYRGEVDRGVEGLTQLIEPLLIAVLGVGVGILVASVLMPIYNIAGGM